MAEQSIEELRDALRGAEHNLYRGRDGRRYRQRRGAGCGTTRRELGAVTVGMATKPFSFEGTRRQRIADEGRGHSRSR